MEVCLAEPSEVVVGDEALQPNSNIEMDKSTVPLLNSGHPNTQPILLCTDKESQP